MCIKNQKNGFTLVELLVVVSIIGTLAGLLLVNFIGIRGRAADARIKSDFDQLKKSLRLYYNDFQVYPGSNTSGSILGCGATGTTACTTGGEFVAGSTTYMSQLPDVFKYYSNGAEGFLLVAEFVNRSDQDIAASQAKCKPGSRSYYTASVSATTYVVCED